MLIVGAKGFAKEILEVFSQLNDLSNIFFYDDKSADLPDLLFGKFPVLQTPDAARQLFVRDPRFVLGIGNPAIRQALAQKMVSLGGELTGCISPRAAIGAFNNQIGQGINIMTGVVITNDVKIGDGVLLNLNCTIGHDVRIGNFCELSPGVHVSGNVVLGEKVVVGTGAVLLPGVVIGDNTVIGAGSVVTKSLEANVVAVGAPAKVIKHLI